MANRYTNIAPAQFNPLSLNEIMMAPLTKQKQHENQQAEMAAAGMFDVNRLSVDDDLIGGDINRMKQGITDIEEQLLKEGVSSGLSKRLIQAKKDREAYLGNEGAGGKAQNAYNAYQANAAALAKRKDLDPRQMQMGLQKALSEYSGVGTNGSYNPYQGASYINIEDLAAKRAGEMSAQEITNITGWQQNKNGMWSNGTETRERLPREFIQQAVMNSMANDIGVQGYLQDAANIGMISDPQKYLENAAWNAADRFQVNNSSVEQDIKLPTAASLAINSSGTNEAGMNWNRVNSPRENQLQEQGGRSESTLSMISRGKHHPKSSSLDKPTYKFLDGAINSSYEEELAAYNKSKENDSRAYDESDIPLEEKARYEEIGAGLVENGRLTQEQLERGITDPEVMKELNDYDARYGNYTHNVSIISDTSGGVGSYSSGTVAKDEAAILRQVQKDKSHQLYMHPETGVVYNWEQMKEEFGVKDVDLVQGYVDVDNNLPSMVKQKEYSSSKSAFAAPMVVDFTDDDGNPLESFYMTRNTGQMNRPRYQADIKLNEFFDKQRSMPEIKSDIQIGNKIFKSSYLPEGTVNEILNTMAPDVVDEFGDMLESADPIQFAMYTQLSKAKRDAGNRDGIYMLEVPDNETGVKKNYKTKQQVQAAMYKAEGLSDFQ